MIAGLPLRNLMTQETQWDLFEDIYQKIYPEMQLLPSFVGTEGKPNIKHNPTAINMNEYFKEA